MPDTPTPKIGLLRPKLGKTPWKKEWDFNMGLLDTDVGGLLDGSVPAGKALTIDPTALIPIVVEISGNLGSTTFPDQTTTSIIIDHSSTVSYILPAEPIFTAPVNVTIQSVGNRNGLTPTDYGGRFQVNVTNTSGAPVTGTSIQWKRRGIKV